MVDGSSFRCREEGCPPQEVSFILIQRRPATLPSVVGSPAFQRPVPVVSGYNSLLPVGITHLNLFFSVFLFGIDISSRNGEKHFGSFACFPRLSVFQMQRCFDLFYASLQCVLLDYEFMIKMNFVCFF